MKHFLRLTVFAVALISTTTVFGQTVTRTYVAPSSTSIDGVGNYGLNLPPVTFVPGDFTDGCVVSDVDVVINWAKTAGTCFAPTGGNSQHQETSFRINSPSGPSEILALPGTWSGGANVASVTTTFSDGNAIPTGTPVTGTFGPNNGSLANYNGLSAIGAWSLDIGDNGASAPLCFTYYQVIVTADPDNTPPVLTVPANITVGPDPGLCGASVCYTLPTATDNCSATVTQTAGPSTCGFFPDGTTTVTYEAADPYGNVTTESFTVTVNAPPSTDPTSITASATTICSGSPVTLSVNGGSLGTGAQWYWYVGSCGGQLIGSGSTITVNPLSTSNYYVQAGGPCNVTACVDVLIEVTPAPVVSLIQITSPSACGAADGTITANATGGTPPYVYTWNGSVGSSTASGLAAGPYIVEVSDATGCSDVTSVSLNDPGAEVVVLTSSDADNVICEGESVTFTASGAFSYQYYINGVPVSTQNPFVTTALQNGDVVDVTGTDFNFCSYTPLGFTFTVLDVPVINETVTDPSACATADGVISTSVSGGLPLYTYLWTPDSATTSGLTGLAAGPYFVTVTDANGCSTNGTYALNDPGAAPVSLASTEDPDNIICAGENIDFTASGSMDYVFFVDGDSVSVTNPFSTTTLTDGQTIVATGTDASNCTATSNIITATVNPGPIVTLVSNVPSDTICVGQSISFFASGAITYEFFVDGVSQGAPSTTTVFVTSTLTTGQVVTVIGTDGNGCDVASAAITVVVNPSPTVVVDNVWNPTACGANDGAITVSASGGTPGYIYSWSNTLSGDSIGGLNSGSYVVLATDAAGCTDATSASLSDVGSTPVSLISTVPNDTICGGDAVTFTASGASTYVFYVNGIAASIQNPYVTDTLVDGDIIAVTGLDTMLCSATSAPVTYTVHPEINIGVTSSINPSACGLADGLANSIVIGGVPTYTYEWNPTSPTQTTQNAIDLAAGAYAVTVTDANGCQASDGVSLSDPGSLVVSMVASPAGLVICEGEEIEFTASGAGTYEFFVGGASVGSANPYSTNAILDGETVAVVGTDSLGCTATSPGLQYQVNSTPVVDLILSTSICSNIDTVVFAGGIPLGGAYEVDYGGTPIIGNLFFPSLTGGGGAINVTYTVTLGNGCSATDSADYVVLAAPEVDLGNDTTVCGITLDAGAGFVAYEWSTADTTATLFVDANGVYSVVVEDANGCFGTDEIGLTVNPIPSPVVSPGGTVEFCIGETQIFNAQTNFTTYSWSTGSDADTTFTNVSDTITLTVTNQYGCEGTATVIAVMNEPMPGAQITWTPSLEFCHGDTVYLNAGPGYSSYLWNTGSTTQTIAAWESGDYTVVVLDGNGCLDSTMTANPVTVTAWDPEPLVQENGDTLTMTNANSFGGYQWYFNGNPIPGATAATYVITENGNYKVCVVDDEGCEGCSIVYEKTLEIGIEEAYFNGDVSVYPNPNNGRFTLEVEMQRQMDMSVGLYDMVGKQVWIDAELGNTSSLRKQYDLSQIPDGVYFLRIYADDQMTVQKLVKQQ